MSRARTCDPMVNSHLLYQLSYHALMFGGDGGSRPRVQNISKYSLIYKVSQFMNSDKQTPGVASTSSLKKLETLFVALINKVATTP